MIRTTYPPARFTIFVLSLCYQLSNGGLSNYTFTSMDSFNKTIPAVCSLTLNCPDMQCNDNMDGPCTLNTTNLNQTTTYCNGSSRVTVDLSIDVIILEDNNTNSNIDILSTNTKSLTCTPLVSCGLEETVNITWNQTTSNGSLSVDGSTELVFNPMQYGTYTCSITSGNTTLNLSYELYGGPRFTRLHEVIRVTLNERVEFSCNPESVPPINSVTWVKDGNMVPDDLLRTLNNSINRIVIGKAKYNDEGVYTCTASNRYSSAKRSFELKVKSPLTPLWPAIGIIIELTLVAVIIIAHERYKHYQEKKNVNRYKPSFNDLDNRDDDDDTEAYNFPSHSQSTKQTQERRHRVDSITRESLLSDSVQ